MTKFITGKQIAWSLKATALSWGYATVIPNANRAPGGSPDDISLHSVSARPNTP